MFQRLCLLTLLGFVCISCRSGTPYDLLFYPADSYYERISDDEDAIVLCQALENEGYVFDEFEISESGIEVNYTTVETVRYTQWRSVLPVVVISTNRDYNNPDMFSEAEWTRIETEAQDFCEAYHQIRGDLGIDLRGVLFWDYINGVRGTYYFAEDCKTDGGSGWGTGTYANRYEENPDAICPSGRVQY